MCQHEEEVEAPKKFGIALLIALVEVIIIFLPHRFVKPIPFTLLYLLHILALISYR